MQGKCARGMIVAIDLAPANIKSGSQDYPCLVLQNDVGNNHSSVTIVAAVVSRERVKVSADVHVEVSAGEAGLTDDSVILCDQLWSVDQRRIRRICGTLNTEVMEQVDAALRISLGLN